MPLATPPEYLTASRPVEPQLDMRNVLTALAGAYKAPQTSYFGLTPDNVQSSAGQQLQRMAEMGGMIQNAQKQAVGQEQQQFTDALNAHKMYLADRDQKMQEALNGLRMQQIRQAMGQSAASHALAIQNAKLNNALYKTMVTVPGLNDANGNPVQVPLGALKGLGGAVAKAALGGGVGGLGGTAAQRNAAMQFGTSFTNPNDQMAAAKMMSTMVRDFNKSTGDARKAFDKDIMNTGKEYTDDMHNAVVDEVARRYSPMFSNQEEYGKFVNGFRRGQVAPSPVQGGEGSLPAAGTTRPTVSPELVQTFLNAMSLNEQNKKRQLLDKQKAEEDKYAQYRWNF